MILVVLDVNDNPPTFSRSDINGFIQEDVTDTLISIPGDLMVEDRDQVQYRRKKIKDNGQFKQNTI